MHTCHSIHLTGYCQALHVAGLCCTIYDAYNIQTGIQHTLRTSALSVYTRALAHAFTHISSTELCTCTYMAYAAAGIVHNAARLDACMMWYARRAHNTERHHVCVTMTLCVSLYLFVAYEMRRAAAAACQNHSTSTSTRMIWILSRLLGIGPPLLLPPSNRNHHAARNIRVTRATVSIRLATETQLTDTVCVFVFKIRAPSRYGTDHDTHTHANKRTHTFSIKFVLCFRCVCYRES